MFTAFVLAVVSTMTAVASACVAGLLGLIAGYFYGRRKHRIAIPTKDRAITDAERRRMVDLLHEIGSWTNEYADEVSRCQSQLGEITKSVNAGVTIENPTVSATSERIVGLLEQFMQNSGQLRLKLDAAEFQLDQKTRQIECYLNEARTDGLTGLFNRRAFDNRLEEMFLKFRRGGSSFVVALVDVDHFKKVNDNYGHQIGDLALQAIASTLKERLKDAVMVARFGGEEFAIIMHGPLLSAAEELNLVRRELEARALILDNAELNTTISVGLSEPKDDSGAAPLVRRADEALYAAKNFGRNRVYFHDGQGPTVVGAPETARSQ